MASKSISQLPSLNAETIDTNDFLTVVDVSEQANVDKNKKITVGNFTTYLRDYTNLFPIDFTSDYIKTDAVVVVDGDPFYVPISPGVSQQIVEYSDIGFIKFDSFGRVYDIVPNTDFAQNQNIILASGTASSLNLSYPDLSTPDQPQPPSVSAAQRNDDSIAGYFGPINYYYPPGTVYPAKINYNIREENDINWLALYELNYQRFKRTEINLVYGGNTLSPDTSNCNIIIDWTSRSISGAGVFSANNNAFPFTFKSVSNSSANSVEIQGIVGPAFTENLAVPKIFINFNGRFLSGLPLPTVKQSNGYQNIGVPILLTIKNYL